MISPQQIVMIVLGAVACFAGYSLFRTMASLWGFLLGGWIGFILLPLVAGSAASNSILSQIIAFVVGGVVGAIVAIPLYFVIIFLSGAALGAMFGTMIGALIDMGGVSSFRMLPVYIDTVFPPFPKSALQLLIGAIAGLILGGAAISFQKLMVIASSSFIGAAALISGLSGSINIFNLGVSSQAAIMLMSWLLLGVIGMIVQYRGMDET